MQWHIVKLDTHKNKIYYVIFLAKESKHMLLILNVSDFRSSLSFMILSLMNWECCQEFWSLTIWPFPIPWRLVIIQRSIVFPKWLTLALADVKFSMTVHCKEMLLLWQDNRL